MRGVVAYEHDPDGTLIRVAGILQDVTPAVADAGDIQLGRTAQPGRRSEY